MARRVRKRGTLRSPVSSTGRMSAQIMKAQAIAKLNKTTTGFICTLRRCQHRLNSRQRAGGDSLEKRWKSRGRGPRKRPARAKRARLARALPSCLSPVPLRSQIRIGNRVEPQNETCQVHHFLSSTTLPPIKNAISLLIRSPYFATGQIRRRDRTRTWQRCLQYLLETTCVPTSYQLVL